MSAYPVSDTPIAIGTTIRSGINGEPYRVGGYLMRFWPDDLRDTYQTYFDAKTDFRLDDYRIAGMPMLFHHGLDPKIGIEPVGRFDHYRVDEWGIWAEGVLDERREYIAQIKALVDQGAFAYSGRTLDEALKIDERTGHVDQWCFIEGSITHTPGDWRSAIDGTTGTSIQPLRALAASLPPTEAMPTEDQAGSSARASEDAGASGEHGEYAHNDRTEERAMTREEIQALVEDLVGRLLTQAGITPAEQAVATEAITNTIEEIVSEAPADEAPVAMSAAQLQRAIQAALTAVNRQRDAADAAVRNALEAARSAAPRESAAERAGAHNPPQRGHAAPRPISVSEDLRFARYSAADLAMAVKLKAHQLRRSGLSHINPLETFSEEFQRTLKHRINDAVRGARPSLSRSDELMEMRAAMPFRADEIDASDNTGYGAEWVSTFTDYEVWEKARHEAQLFSILEGKGMRVKQVGPNGTADFYTEGSDPVVHTARQANNIDATGRPEVVTGISPIGTGKVTLTPAEWRTAVAYTVTQEESSQVDWAQQVVKQLNASLAETMESGAINGDIRLAAATNINSIDGAAQVIGIGAPSYLAFDGLRVRALIANSGDQALDASNTFSTQQMLATLGALPSRYRAMLNQCLFIVDAATYLTGMGLAIHATDDVRRQGGTWSDGMWTKAWGVDVYQSGFLPLSNTAGKVSDTPANNVRGTILVTNAARLMWAWAREITIENDRDILSGSNIYVASARMVMGAFDNRVAAESYNVNVITTNTN